MEEYDDAGEQRADEGERDGDDAKTQGQQPQPSKLRLFRASGATRVAEDVNVERRGSSVYSARVNRHRTAQDGRHKQAGDAVRQLLDREVRQDLVGLLDQAGLQRVQPLLLVEALWRLCGIRPDF